ncbi:MAG: hypothetical protein ACK5O2_10395 [Microthrixaceae bacterium]
MTSTRPKPTDRFRDPLADPVYDAKRIRLAALMGFMGVAHFVVPGPFRKVVPKWFPWPREAVAVSGVAEVASAVLLANPRSKRVGGWLAAGTLVAVYPANVQMAIDAIRVPSGPKRYTAVALAWLRLPLQLPMISTALRAARG